MFPCKKENEEGQKGKPKGGYPVYKKRTCPHPADVDKLFHCA